MAQLAGHLLARFGDHAISGFILDFLCSKNVLPLFSCVMISFQILLCRSSSDQFYASNVEIRP